jgi:hypothetical protein
MAKPRYIEDVYNALTRHPYVDTTAWLLRSRASWVYKSHARVRRDGA